MLGEGLYWHPILTLSNLWAGLTQPAAFPPPKVRLSQDRIGGREAAGWGERALSPPLAQLGEGGREEGCWVGWRPPFRWLLMG
jgi:hypothetical protein